MPTAELRYGHGVINVEFDGVIHQVLSSPAGPRPLSDLEIGARLDSPLGTPRLEDIVSPGQTVLFVVPDATRRAGVGQVINLVVRRLIANGSAPSDLSIIFATGIHRKPTPEEQAEILTPFIAQRFRLNDHDARDLASLTRLGETNGGVPIELNRALFEHDHVVLLGGVTFHYFAGFTGGRKLVCPGLASARTISGTHKLAFDCETLDRRRGVGTGLLDGNPVHEAFVEVVQRVDPAFAVSTIVDDEGAVVDVFCGHWVESHGAACDEFAGRHTVTIDEKRPLVLASCGGWPYDINMIQAHKALEAASHACTDGGTIVLLAECVDGPGRDDFLDWFAAANSDALARDLCRKYQVNGQTAWSLLRKAERFDIRIVTELSDEACSRMRLKRIGADEVRSMIDSTRPGFLMTAGAKVSIRTSV